MNKEGRYEQKDKTYLTDNSSWYLPGDDVAWIQWELFRRCGLTEEGAWSSNRLADFGGEMAQKLNEKSNEKKGEKTKTEKKAAGKTEWTKNAKNER